MKQTILHDAHIAAHAKMVDFAGWSMPIHYGSQLQEHAYVREDAGIFDVSHMCVIDLKGSKVPDFLKKLLANNIDKLSLGKALYSCMLNLQGGILDDLIVYKIQDDFFRLVVNAGTSDKDLAWIKENAKDFAIDTIPRRDLSIIATQGPKACEKIIQAFPKLSQLATLKPFQFTSVDALFIARTGYTGEDGFEWIIPEDRSISLWNQFLECGFKPCGLAARDTLRLEAGLNLYGLDMDETVTPLESNLSWTVAMNPPDRQFIGRSALEQQLKEGVKRQLVGLLLNQGIPRSHQVVLRDQLRGEITSGTFSPTLKKGIALARVPVGSFDECSVQIRDKLFTATIVKPPFVKFGKSVFSKEEIK